MRHSRFNVPLFFLTVLQFLLQHTELFSVWIGILVWEACTKTSVPAQIKWPLFGGAFVVASFWNWRREVLRARAAEAALAAQGKKSPPARISADDSASLLERYGQTGTLADKLLTPYLEKWTRIAGSFEATADSLAGDAIYLSLILENGRRIHLRFAGEARDRLRLLREGQQLRAVCQIRHGFGAGVFTLENCELTRVEPFRPAFARAS